ncbi:MAG: hypothetical protein LBG89_01400, partial [Rickettsiales bacterium]|nr:hypothetical protein [Rickettsiales bacterium]
MAIFIGGHTYNPMTGLVLKYLMENPKLDNNDVYPFMPKCMKYRLGYIALVARDGDVIRNADTKRRLAVICDDGEGMLPENAAPFISRFPFMLDLHLRANSETDLTRYAGAEIVSMDKETLDFLNSEPSSLRQNYKWNDIVVNHGLHSVWFGDKITDFKYHDGVENECTYESKREIVA